MRQLGDFVGDLANQPLLFRIFHVDGRAHMQYPGVDMAKHAVLQATGVERGTKLSDKVSQLFRWHRSVFNEGNRTLFALGVDLGIAQQAYGALAHGINLVDLFAPLGQGKAKALDAGIRLQMTAEGGNPLGEPFGIVIVELHQVDTAYRRLAAGEERRHAVPDEILHGQQQDLVVDCFDGGGERLSH